MRNRSQQHRRSRPCVEALEGRQVMSALAATPVGSISALAQRQNIIDGRVTGRDRGFRPAILLDGRGTFMGDPVKVTGWIHGASLWLTQFNTGRLRISTDTGVSPVKLIGKVYPFPFAGPYTFTVPRGEFRGVSGTVNFEPQVTRDRYGVYGSFRLTFS